MAKIQSGSPSEPLTSREREILACLAGDLSNQEIAEKLFLAEKTIRWYNSQIYSKLGVNNREDAVKQAESLGLLDSKTPKVTNGKHNLPTQVTPFVGRRHELGEVAALLDEPMMRLITILAPGGMGKTRLSIEAARSQIGRSADGVYFVPLAPLSVASDIVTTIAENMGFSFYGQKSSTQQLMDFLADRDILLVLDNFEHLLEGAPMIAELLQAAPRLRVLITSRERLNLQSETVYLLRGMEFPSWETPEDALEYDAVKLFMQSAHRVRPDFEIQAKNLDYLARICRLTEGLPLGIELAAGWVDVLTLEQIAVEIQKGIDILETDLRDVPERQRSIRATFNRTWEKLTADEQAVFMRLSVFRGGFTVEAARIVAGADMRSLRKLVNKALVQVAPDGRHDLHELLRQFGEEKLMLSGEAEIARQAHSSYYMAFMAARDADIKGKKQQAGLHEIRADFENIRQGWLWAAEHRQYEVIAGALDCLVNFAEMSFSGPDAQAILQQTVTALRPAEGEPHHPVWDQAVVRRERVNFMLDDQINHEQIEMILERARERNNQHEMAYCLWVLADYSHRIADYKVYQTRYEECLALRQSVGDPFYIAHTFVGIHDAYTQRSEIDRRNDCLRESVRIRREIGDHSNLCFSLGGLSYYLSMNGDFAEADAMLDEALTIRGQIGRTPINNVIAIFKAIVAFWRGELQTAVQQIHAWEEYTEGRDIFFFNRAYIAVSSWVATVGGDPQRGYDLCLSAEPDKLGDWVAQSVAWGLTLAQCGLGNNEAARRQLRDTLKLSRDSLKSPTLQQLCLPLAAVVAARTGQPERGVELLGLAYAAPKEVTGWMAHWQLLTDLRRDLEAELGAEAYAAAWAHGENRELSAVVAELLAEAADE